MGPRSTRLGSLAAVLLLFAACLGSREGGDGCACRDERAAKDPSSGSASLSTPSSPAPVTAALAADAPAATMAPPAPAEPAAEIALPDFSDPAWTRLTSRAGTYLVCWRTTTGEVVRNQDFELEVWVVRDGKAVPGAVLSVSAWMPEHGHGMLRAVRPEARGDGSFRVEGMLLHMRGHWLLRFDVLEGSLSETAECALEM